MEKKNSNKSKINKVAREMFLEMNYDEVSMRDIAAKSDMTVGNIYRYYTNKEILFDEIVLDCYEKVMKLIGVSEHLSAFLEKNPLIRKNKGVYKNQKFKKSIYEIALNLIVNNSTEVYVLLCNSRGSKYEDLFVQIKSIIKDTIVLAVGFDEDTSETYAYMTIVTIIHILKKHIGDKQKLESSCKFFLTKLFESLQ